MLNALPRGVALAFFGPLPVSTNEDAHERAEAENEALIRAVEQSLLAPFGDAFVTRHLGYALLEEVVGVLCPELLPGAARGKVSALLEERGVAGGYVGR